MAKAIYLLNAFLEDGEVKHFNAFQLTPCCVGLHMALGPNLMIKFPALMVTSCQGYNGT